MKFITALLILMIAPLSVWAQNTLPYFDGVAIMDGFNVSDEDIMVFDKPEGRVIEISLWCTTSCPSEQAIRHYYTENLMTMGWQSAQNGGYVNNNTHLTLDILSDKSTGGTIILFRSNG